MRTGPGLEAARQGAREDLGELEMGVRKGLCGEGSGLWRALSEGQEKMAGLGQAACGVGASVGRHILGENHRGDQISRG